jgi:hypothetical protein
MPGKGVLIEGAVQQAAQPGRQSMAHAIAAMAAVHGPAVRFVDNENHSQ